VDTEGQTAWRFRAPGPISTLTLASGEYLIAGGENRRVHLFDLKDDR
jgi:hypothetical protein